MNLKLIVVEDEFSILMDITRRLKKMGHEIIASTMSYEEALVALVENKPDMMLLDINLNAEKSGINVAEKLHNFNIPFIYITASSDKKTFDEAKKTRPFGFIIKPFKDEDLRNTIELAYEQFLNQQAVKTENSAIPQADVALKPENAGIFIKVNGQLENLDMNEILYLEAMDNYTHIFTTTKRHTVHAAMKNVLAKLPTDSFIRVHRSYVVSIQHVKTVEGDSIFLNGSKHVPMSKTYKSEFMSLLNILD
jgi:DNA-binding LytR/AlgR family response regulator